MQENNLNVSLDKTTGIKCDKCKNEVFHEGMMLRKVSKFLVGSSQDALIPIPVFVCSKCGHVNDEFLPMQLREQDNEYAEVVELGTKPPPEDVVEGESPNKSEGKIISMSSNNVG